MPNDQYTLVTQRPYCPGRPKKLCFTTLSLAMETMGIRLCVVKQSFFGPRGQYGRLVTRANAQQRALQVLSSLERDVIYVFFLLACFARHALNPRISCKLSWNLPFRKKMTGVWFLNLVEKRKEKHWVLVNAINRKLYKKTAGIHCDKAEALFLSRHGPWLENETNRRHNRHGPWLENETNRRHNTADTLDPYNNSSYRRYQRF